MKNFYMYIVLLCISYPIYSQPFTTEIDFQMMKEDDPNYKLERLKWMEDMHRAAPGTDWRKVDAQIRERKQQVRKEKIEALIRKNVKIESIQSDTVADGKLIGQWIERGSNNLAGRMLTSDIDWETGLLYNASSGGNIWRGTLEGEDWTCLNNGKKMGGIILLKIIKMNDTKRIFVISGKRGFYTDNEGLTWESSLGLEKPQNWGGVRRAVMTNDENHHIYFLGNEWDYQESKSVSCIYKSTDFGETFDPIYKFSLETGMCDLWTPKYFNSDVYFLHLDTLSKILPDGTIENIASIELDSAFSNYKQARLSGSVSEEGTTIFLWLQNKSDNFSHFFSTDDFGESWETLGIIDYGPFSTNSFEASCIHPEALYFGGVNCSRSLDRGKTWEIVNTWGEYYGDMENKLYADLPAITSYMNPDGDELVIISTDGGSYISYDNLVTVQNISMNNLNVSQYYSTYSFEEDPDIIFVGSQDQGFQRTTAVAEDGTHSFQQTISGDYGHLTSSDGGKTLWCVYPGFTMLYKDLATSPTTLRRSLDFDETGTGGLWMRPILADPKDPDVAYLAGGGTDGFHHIWKITYKGGKITGAEMPYRFDSTNVVSALGISNINQDLFYAMTKNGNFFNSSNRGQDWTMSEGFASMGGHHFYGASIAPSNIDANTVYIAGSGTSNPRAYVSYDYGQSFTPIDSGLPNTLVYRIALSEDDNYIFAATAVGPYVFIKDEGMWFDLAGLDTPDQTYWCVEYIPSIMTVRFGTYGRGIWDFRIDDINRINEVALIEPENESDDIALDTILKWTESENAEFYHVQIATDSLFRNIFINIDSLTTNLIEIDSLKPNETYFWRVKAKKDNFISSWSKIFSFKTIMIMPYGPALLKPVNNAEQIALMPFFEWEQVPYATSYHLQVADNMEFENPFMEIQYLPTNSFEARYYLEGNTKYYWRISSRIKLLESEFSDIYSFTTVVPRPTTPILEYPEFAQNEVPLNVKMIWSEVENADFYSLQISGDNRFYDILFEKDTIFWYSYKFKGDELESFKLYHWHVSANNKSGAGDWSERGMFVMGNAIGVKETISNENTHIYPNPVSDKLFIGIDAVGKIHFSIIGVLGNTVMSDVIDDDNQIHTIDVSSLLPGTYFLRLESSSGIVVRKLNIMR
ncbi:T9SS type A sorting domain-containing protein [Bacteroidota bacterium]